EAMNVLSSAPLAEAFSGTRKDRSIYAPVSQLLRLAPPFRYRLHHQEPQGVRLRRKQKRKAKNRNGKRLTTKPLEMIMI
ncbi:hypothetical protein PILCRDRAFT_812501, partial [Piloderma croceum F 1598]